jgi:hypothetical protein
LKGKYKKCIVAFIDVVGFREHILGTRSNSKNIESIHFAFSSIEKYSRFEMSFFRKTSPMSVKIKMFSDTIVISSSNTSWESFISVLGDVSQLQALLTLCGGFFLRGCITVGDHYQDNNILFGPAVIRAYDLERIALWPRVILDPNILTLPKMDRSYLLHRHFCRVGHDGLLYVDYLTMFFEYQVWRLTKETPAIAPEYIFMIHRKAILDALRTKAVKSDLSVLLKYQSLTKYHNAVISEALSRYAKTVEYTSGQYTIANDFLKFLSEIGQPMLKIGPEETRELYIKLLQKQKINPIKAFAKLHGK